MKPNKFKRRKILKISHSMEIIDKVLYRYFSRVLDILAICLLSILVIVVFINVCSRYALNLSLAWSEELAKILLVWVTFIGAAVASRQGRHLKIEDVLKRMDEKRQRKMYIYINVVVSLFLVFMIWKGFSFSIAMKDIVTDALQISNMILYAAIPVGAVLMLPYSIRNIIYYCSERR
ncbi:MAG TPA: TRAP transporter small permease [Desulfatiglandales bacterium]|nr:TRAP transporter small permease [Desulfatiglandales bacterium]